MASLAGVDAADPRRVERSVEERAGDYFVTLPGAGRLRVDGPLAKGAAATDRGAYVALIEKAGLALLGENADAKDALHLLTGAECHNAQVSAARVWAALCARSDNGRLVSPVVARTRAESVFAALLGGCADLAFIVGRWLGLCSGSRPQYVAHHCYAIIGIGENPPLGRYLTVYNPMGNTEGRPDGPDDGLFRVPLDEFCHKFDVFTCVGKVQ